MWGKHALLIPLLLWERFLSVNCATGDDTFCIACDKAASRCSRCVNSFTGSDGACGRLTSNITHCEVYQDASYCAQCTAGYMFYEGGCIENGIEGCRRVQGSSTSVCAVCYNSTLPDSAGHCASTGVRCSDANCLSCAALGSCEQCNSGFYLSADSTTCSAYPTPVPAWLRSCEQAATASSCARCAHGTYVSQGLCLVSGNTAVPWKRAGVATLFAVFCLAFFM